MLHYRSQIRPVYLYHPDPSLALSSYEDGIPSLPEITRGSTTAISRYTYTPFIERFQADLAFVASESLRQFPEPQAPLILDTETLPTKPPGRLEMVIALRELRAEDEQEDGETLRPSDYAFNVVKELLIEASNLIVIFPYGSVVADGDRGLRVEWKHNRRRVNLVVPDKGIGEPYIYYSDGQTRQLESKADEVTLAARLNWLTHERQA